MKLALILAMSMPVMVHADAAKCLFLSAIDGPPFSFELPEIVLSHPLSTLPLSFHGFTPIVTRVPLASGQTKPTVTIQRYSQRPDVYYDQGENRIVVKAASCDLPIQLADKADEVMIIDEQAKAGGEETAKDTESMSSSGATSKTPLWMWSASALVAAAVGGGSTGAMFAAALSLASTNSMVHAHEEDCQPVVQILVQAPAAYTGAVQICREEINDPAICPDDFPTFATCNDTAPNCEVAVVGAGAGGLYTALRYALLYPP
jgi:hypothetical protein